MKVDTLIVGQGLAGSVLAWRLLRRGQRILVVDRDEEVTSSKVAAGLVTPIAGSRFQVPDDLEERLLSAQQFYFECEEETGSRFFHHRKIARLFRNEKEGENWDKRLASSDEITRYHAPLEIDETDFCAPHGGFEMQQGGWLDVPAFLEATRQALLERASYAIARVDSADVRSESGGIRWKNIEADHVVFAEGWRGNQNRFFDWLPLQPTVGDILEVRIPSLSGESRIVNRGGWLLPLGDGRFRAGSTYRHEAEDESPTQEGRELVEEKLKLLTSCPYEVTRHEAAARPVIRRSQVFAGLHPSEERVVLFNGLGSKGVLNAPWFADRLADLLLDGVPLPPENDIRSNLL